MTEPPFFIDAETGYVAGGGFDSPYGLDGALFRTTDGGQTWSDLIENTTTVNGLHDVFFTDVNTGFVVGPGGSILKATLPLFREGHLAGLGECARLEPVEIEAGPK